MTGTSSPPADDDTGWCNLSEGARRLGVSPQAVRNRVRRRTIISRPRGNQGHDVWVPVPEPVPPTVPLTVPERVPGTGSSLDHLTDALVAELRGRVAELQARASASEAERVAAGQQAAQERVQAAEERGRLQTALTAALTAREGDLEHHRREIAELRRQLQERPWWRRIWAA